MANTVTHFLSGTALAAALPSATIEDKIVLVAGTVLPDLIFTPYIFAIAKVANKKVNKLTEDDFSMYGYSTPKIRLLKKIYFISHGLPLIFLFLVLSEWKYTFVYLALGFILHILYDLFMHKYEDDNFIPRPLYPLSSIKFKYGITNGWRITWKERILSWSIHILIIFFILYLLK